MTIQYFKLSDLKIAGENTRKTRDSESVRVMAESIKSIGLLHSLVGYKQGKTIHITDGGTRLEALRRLAKDKDVSATLTQEIAVNLCDKEQAIDTSLSANLVRNVMRPTDQFKAFHNLHHIEKIAVSDIAARYYVDAQTVTKILKLASLAKPIFEALESGEISLDIAKIYAGCSDQDRQLQAFEACGVGASPHMVRSVLRENSYSANSAKVAFIGLDKYLEAGGKTEDDLFEDKTVLLDGHIVDQLMTDAIAEFTDSLLEQGWSHVQYFESSNSVYDESQKLGQRIFPKLKPNKSQQKKLDALETKMSSYENYWQLDDADKEAYDKLNDEYQSLEAEASHFSDEDKETGLCLWYFGHDGPSVSFYAPKVAAQKPKEKALRDYPESFERNVMLTAGDALMEHLTRNPSEVVTALTIAALEYQWFPCLNLSLLSRPKLKFDRNIEPTDNAVGERSNNSWDAGLSEIIKRVKELTAMTETERQSILANILRQGFAVTAPSGEDDENDLFAYVADKSGFSITDYWTFGEAELKCLTKAQLLRILGTMGLNPASFSKAKKSELVTVTARYAQDRKWTPEFLSRVTRESVQSGEQGVEKKAA